MRIEFGVTSHTPGTALVVFAAKDAVLSGAAQALDAALGGAVANAVKTARFEGDVAQIVELLAPSGTDASRVLLVGTGKPGHADAAVFERIGGALAARLLTSGETKATVDFGGLSDLALDTPKAAAHLALGASLRAWRFDKYRTKLPEKQKPTLAEIAIANAGSAGQEWARLEPLVEAVGFTRSLVAEPGNVIYPESFVERCRPLADLGIKIEVLDESEMRAAGMGALLGVAQGSAKPPRLLVMEWDGTGGKAKTSTVFIGKGVTFDTGGISIKPAAGMEDMKWDMGGAGAVAGAMKALALRRAKARVVGICGLVENMPDGNAQRPGDVVTTMSGQTVEVINTDAEGRLVLCDAITWAQKRFNPEVIVDLATLTGAIIISLGHEYAGIFSNSDELAKQLVSAGIATGDKLWRFPLGSAYDKMIDSPIADMKNVGSRDAGSITAAQFIGRFVNDGVKWAHLDIAGMAWSAKAGATWEKGATGYGVRLLDRFVEDTLEA
ncbi:MAG: leucyl aminopeptidase [Pseudomonadota bacterium]|jgi:leucyl aminopeptidase|nr:leucyl aminopeptidase [Pseudomonadota bacterium]